MKAIRFEIIFSLEACTSCSENKGALFSNMTSLFLRASSEFDPFTGSRLGL